MFGTSRRGLRVVIDCADPRPLLELQRRSRPRGVRVRCRQALRARDDAVQPVLQAEVHAASHCSPQEVGAWLSACFAGSQAPWYVDGVPAGPCPTPAHAGSMREVLLLFAR